MILFFDTETTGLYPGRIIQLSYILADGVSLKAKNFFFAVEYIEPSASAVNGFTVEKLAELSQGRTFSWDIDEIYDDFSSAETRVAHNFSFDLSFMIAEFRYLDRVFRYNEAFDTMKYFTPKMKLERTSHRGYKYPKLSEVCEFLDVYPYDVTRASGKIFGETAVAAHDARYDATALYLCFEEGGKKFEDLRETALKYLQNSGEM